MNSVRRFSGFFFLLVLFLLGIFTVGVAAQNTKGLSGNYQLHFEQVSKSCGQTIKPVDVTVALTFSDDSVSLSFPYDFLGIKLLKARFDSKSGTVSDNLEQRVSLGETNANLSLNINGNVSAESDNPQINFEVKFDKIADDSAWNCNVTGKGTATKV